MWGVDENGSVQSLSPGLVSCLETDGWLLQRTRHLALCQIQRYFDLFWRSFRKQEKKYTCRYSPLTHLASIGGMFDFIRSLYFQVNFTFSISVDSCLKKPVTLKVSPYGYNEVVNITLQPLCECDCSYVDPNNNCSGNYVDPDNHCSGWTSSLWGTGGHHLDVAGGGGAFVGSEDFRLLLIALMKKGIPGIFRKGAGGTRGFAECANHSLPES